MGESGAKEGKAPVPIQQMQQPQPLQGAKDEGLSARAGSLSAGLLTGGGKRSQAKEEGEEKEEGERGFDEARFTAGIGRVHEFYEAVLKEPIPEKMLRLIGEIAKRERGS